MMGLRSMTGWLLVSAMLAGCSAHASEVEEEGPVSSEAHSTLGLGARRQLSGFKCPKDGAPIKVAFYDADSTLRVSKQNAITANGVADVDVLPFAAKHIAARNDEGYLVAIVSNQGGIAAGKTTFEIAEGALLTTARKLGRLGAKVNYFDFAEAEDGNRKPEIGMATRLDDLLRTKCGRGIDFAASTMVGDSGYKKDVDGPHPDGRAADDFSNADRLFAENAGLKFEEPTDAFGWREFGVFNVVGERELVPLLDHIAARAKDLRVGGDDERADELEAEVAANREENELED